MPNPLKISDSGRFYSAGVINQPDDATLGCQAGRLSAGRKNSRARFIHLHAVHGDF